MTQAVKHHESKQHLSNAVESGPLVFTAGVVAKNLDLDAKGQSQEILGEIERLLKLAGSDKSKLVSATIWVSDIGHRTPFNEVWINWLGGNNAPARACVQATLANPKALVEVAVVAAK